MTTRALKPLLTSVTLWLALAAYAADAQQSTPSEPTAQAQSPTSDAVPAVEEVIVTGTAGGGELRKQDASFAITTISADALLEAAPKSTAEIFNLVPGVWAESSSGVAGANIDVRGLPGGSDAPFVTVSLNGAPIYGTESLSFFEQSSMFRADETIRSVEALRGGPNAVFSRGEPGVTLNFRLREGTPEREGTVKYTTSDYDLQRVDARMSGPINDSWFYMIGGYVARSPGVRDAQFTSEKGSQFTAHLTGELERGKLGFFARYTDDFGQWYLPMSLNSGNDLGTFSQLGNATRRRELQINANGDRKEFDFADGRGWKGLVSGSNLVFDLTSNLTLRDNLSFTRGDADTLGFVPDGSPVMVAALPGAMAVTAGGVTLAGNERVQNYGHWVVQKDLRSLTNDLSVTWALGEHDVTAGYYAAKWSSDDFWTIGNGIPVHNVEHGDRLAAGISCQTLQAAGSGSSCFAFGLQSQGDARVNAFYLADSWQVTERLRLDGGVRRESLDLDYLLDSGPGFPDGTRDLDTSLSNTEEAYTLAANFEFTPGLGVFVRYSDGYLFPGFDNVRESDLNINGVQQLEAGIKLSSADYGLFATLFFNENDSFSSILGGATPASRFKTEAQGVELDGFLRFGDFRLDAIATLQDSEVKASTNPDEVGNRIQRQPQWQVRLAPSYSFALRQGWEATVYGAFVAVGDRFGALDNVVTLSGYEKLDLGVTVRSDAGVAFQVFADNLNDSHGLTEGDPRSSAANGRPILGRSIRFSVAYDF